MKKIGGWLLVLILFVLVGYGWWIKKGMVDPKGINQGIMGRGMEMYDFDTLKKRQGISSVIGFTNDLPLVNAKRSDCRDEKYCTKKINFKTKEISFISNGKRISGMANYWDDGNKRPIIVMIRGYADIEGYYVGSGSWRVADKLAEAGFNTISIDFLGFGNSDNESTDILVARFDKVPQVLDLIESVKVLPYVDREKIGIWAHSNGGQIALSVLEITGKQYPTVLWAPMTNPFPQSVLDTTEEDSEVRMAIENFGKQYDFRRYAFENYYEWINAPILIHQGTADEWCQVDWQRKVVENLKLLGKKAELDIVAGDDHNLSKNWDKIVGRDLVFFDKFLKQRK